MHGRLRSFFLLFTILGDTHPQKHIVKFTCLKNSCILAERSVQLFLARASQMLQPGGKRSSQHQGRGRLSTKLLKHLALPQQPSAAAPFCVSLVPCHHRGFVLPQRTSCFATAHLSSRHTRDPSCKSGCRKLSKPQTPADCSTSEGY